MDIDRFDRLSRLVSSSRNRREVLGVLAGALGGAALAAPEVAVGKRRRCKGGRKRCSGTCTDLSTSPTNCGACGNACNGNTTCVSGACVNTPGGGLCPDPCPDNLPTCCGQACTDTLGDPSNCGGCGIQCEAGQTCEAGNCTGGGGGGDCVPACGFNLVCQGGACVPAANVCPAPFDCPDPFGGPAPVCGSVAGGGTCGCFRTTEGNNACVNESQNGQDIDSSTLRPCSSSQECRDTVGFHFYCLAVNRTPSGKLCGSSVSRCWPECDNPNV